MRQSPSLKDLVTILYQPRETMRRILDGGRQRWGVQVVMLAAVCAAVNDADVSHAGRDLPQLKAMPLLAIIALGLVAQAIAWVILLFVVAWMATPVGRFLGGTAPVADVRAALGWSMTPVVWSPIYRIPLLIFASRMHVGPKVNLHATLVDFVSRGGCSVLVVYLFLQGAFTVWCIVLASFTVAEAQRFSTQKGFVTVLATLALPVLVVAAAVLAFRS